VKQRHVSAYLEAIFRFTKCWLIETNIRPVWLDVEISSSAQYSGGYKHVGKRYRYTYVCETREKTTPYFN
jgi:hypothetical protein